MTGEEARAPEEKVHDDEKVAGTVEGLDGHEAGTGGVDLMTKKTTLPSTRQISSGLISQKAGLYLHALN